MEWCWRPSRSSMTAEVAAVGVAIDGDDGGPWLVVMSLVIDRPTGDDDEDDDGDYRPSSRRPNSSGSKLRWRWRQMRLCRLDLAIQWNERIRHDYGDDRWLAKVSAVASSFRMGGRVKRNRMRLNRK